MLQFNFLPSKSLHRGLEILLGVREPVKAILAVASGAVSWTVSDDNLGCHNVDERIEAAAPKRDPSTAPNNRAFTRYLPTNVDPPARHTVCR